MADASVVDQHVDAAVLSERLADAPLHGGLVADIEPMSSETPSRCARSRSASALFTSRTVATVVKPDFARSTAVERPIPDEVPVTSAIFDMPTFSLSRTAASRCGPVPPLA